MTTTTSFKDKRGRYLTESLFVEKKRKDSPYDPVFTLRDEDLITGEISLRRKYLEYADPTEYKFAKAMLGDFKHWQILCEREWFKPYVEAWRIEVQVQIESDAVQVFKEVAKDKQHSGRIQAAKALLDRPWEKKLSLRGRPSKKEIEGYKKNIVRDSEDVDNDYNRLLKAQD